MEQLNQAVKTFDQQADSLLKSIEKPNIVKGIIILLLALYAAHIAPTPPMQIIQLFDNIYFKLFVFSLILWSAQFSPSISILIAIGFLVTNNYATTGKLWESMTNTKKLNYNLNNYLVKAPGTTVEVPIDVNQSIDAVVQLSQAASSPIPSDVQGVQQVVEIAMAGVSTETGANSVIALAQQAVIPQAGEPEKIQQDANEAITSITSEVQAGEQQQDTNEAITSETCYPTRTYDLSKVYGRSIDDYAIFTSFEDIKLTVQPISKETIALGATTLV